jgi:hypothetical protein
MRFPSKNSGGSEHGFATTAIHGIRSFVRSFACSLVVILWKNMYKPNWLSTKASVFHSFSVIRSYLRYERAHDKWMVEFILLYT